MKDALCAGPQFELGEAAPPSTTQRDIGAQAKMRPVRSFTLKNDFAVARLPRVWLGPAVIEGRSADHIETHFAADGLGAANELMGRAPFRHRHEVRDFRDPFVGEKTGQEDVGIGKVDLLVPRIGKVRADFEAAAFLIIEDRRENRGRIELRETHEIDRPIHPDERDGMEIADDAVILDWLITHASDAATRRARCF